MDFSIRIWFNLFRRMEKLIRDKLSYSGIYDRAFFFQRSPSILFLLGLSRDELFSLFSEMFRKDGRHYSQVIKTQLHIDRGRIASGESIRPFRLAASSARVILQISDAIVR